MFIMKSKDEMSLRIWQFLYSAVLCVFGNVVKNCRLKKIVSNTERKVWNLSICKWRNKNCASRRQFTGEYCASGRHCLRTIYMDMLGILDIFSLSTVFLLVLDQWQNWR